MAIDYKVIGAQVESYFDLFPKTPISFANPASSSGTYDPITGTRSGSGLTGSFNVVDLGETSGSKSSVSSNAIAESEIFTLVKLLPEGFTPGSSSTFTLYGERWSYLNHEITPGNIGIFISIRRVNG